MKRAFLSFNGLSIAGHEHGQAQEGELEYQKNKQPVAVIELPYHTKVITAALGECLSKKGKSKGNGLKGFMAFQNADLKQNGKVIADLNFRVERKSRKEKEISTVYLVLTMPKETSSASANPDYLNIEQAKTYLNNLVPAIRAFNLELEINDQNEAVNKAESKYKSLAHDAKSLEKKSVSIEKKIRGNKLDKEIQMNQVENQRHKLAMSVSQRQF